MQVKLDLLLLIANHNDLAFVMGHVLALQFLGHLDSTLSRKVARKTDADLPEKGGLSVALPAVDIKSEMGTFVKDLFAPSEILNACRFTGTAKVKNTFYLCFCRQ